MGKRGGVEGAEVGAYRVEFEDREGERVLQSVERVTVGEATERPGRPGARPEPKLDFAGVGSVDPNPTRMYEVAAAVRESRAERREASGFREKAGELLERLRVAMARENSRDGELER